MTDVAPSQAPKRFSLARLFKRKEPESYARASLYEFSDHLGSGVMSEVKRAYATKLERQVAVKIVPKRLQRGRDAFREWIATLRGWKHRNIVHVLDLYESRSTFFVVMELGAKGELFHRLKTRGAYREPDARRFVGALVDAVGFIHSKGWIHRDLKPENILLRSEDPDDFFIIDFELATPHRNGDPPKKSVCGSPGYAAPEIFRGWGYGFEVDMWAVGVMTYILLANIPPFKTKDYRAIIDESLKGDFDYPPERWAHLSSESQDFTRSLLTPWASQRPLPKKAAQYPWLVSYTRSPTKVKPSKLSSEPSGVVGTHSTIEDLHCVLPKDEEYGQLGSP